MSTFLDPNYDPRPDEIRADAESEVYWKASREWNDDPHTVLDLLSSFDAESTDLDYKLLHKAMIEGDRDLVGTLLSGMIFDMREAALEAVVAEHFEVDPYDY